MYILPIGWTCTTLGGLLLGYVWDADPATLDYLFTCWMVNVFYITGMYAIDVGITYVKTASMFIGCSPRDLHVFYSIMDRITIEWYTQFLITHLWIELMYLLTGTATLWRINALHVAHLFLTEGLLRAMIRDN